jgi:hypothetical protein
MRKELNMKHTMIRITALAATALALAGAISGLASCAIPAGTATATDKGTLTVKIGMPPSRTAVASQTEYTAAIRAYKITVSNADRSYTNTFALPSALTLSGIVAGEYTVSVQAYSDAGATAQIAFGTAPASLVATGTANTTVNLSFSQTGSSSYNLKITWPASAGYGWVGATWDKPYSERFPGIVFPGADIGGDHAATIADGGADSGAHKLYIYFKTSEAATDLVGPFIEEVNLWDGVASTMWQAADGTLSDTRVFGPSDFPNRSSLLGGYSAGPVLSFASATTVYSWEFTTNQEITVSAGNASQKLTYYWNDTELPWASVSGINYTTQILTKGTTGTNTLTIIVTAEDGSKTTYIFSDGSSSNGESYSAAAFKAWLATAGDHILTNDVTIEDAWTSAASIPGSTSLNGAGHTVTLTQGGTAPLISNIQNTNRVSNLRVKVADGKTLSTSATSGILAGASFGTIINCSTEGSINGGSNNEIGGLVGKIIQGTITGCSSTAAVSGYRYVGGLVGFIGVATLNNGIIISNSHHSGGDVQGAVVDRTYAGGLVGANGTYNGGYPGEGAYYGAAIYNCSNESAVSGNSYVGGLCGYNAGILVRGSHARGSITATQGSLGGLFGVLSGTPVSYCFSDGSVTGNGPGGFTGQSSGVFSNCYSLASVRTTGAGTSGGFAATCASSTQFINCFAMGTINAGTNTGGVFIGNADGGTFTNCYAAGNCSVGSSGGFCASKATSPTYSSCYYDFTKNPTAGDGDGTGIMQRTTAQMKAKTTFSGWDFDGTWAISPDVNNGYPYLRGMTSPL